MATRSKRGFAAMDPEERRRIASEGGRAAHEKGTAHEFNSQTAREAAESRRGRSNKRSSSRSSSGNNEENMGNE